MRRSSDQLIVGPLVRRGSSDGSGVSIWVETSQPGQVTASDVATSTFTIAGRHYAVVEVDEDKINPRYTVELNGRSVWPQTAEPPNLRRWSTGEAYVISGGSCRQQAPLEADLAGRVGRVTFGALGRSKSLRRPSHRLETESTQTPVTDELGVDALGALAAEVIRGERNAPHLLLLTGDQVYADEQHSSVERWLRRRRGGPPRAGYPEVSSFEEYAWLYEKTWSHPLIRWILSSIPTLMIFDDHDVIDDWNISDTWVAAMNQEPWWHDRVTSALMAYWVYQHLGNMSAESRQSDDLFAAVRAEADGAGVLREHVRSSLSPDSSGAAMSWSFTARCGPVDVAVLDARQGRVLDPGSRSILSDNDWQWLSAFLVDRDRRRPLLAVSSVPWALPHGVDLLERWISGLVRTSPRPSVRRTAERIRRAIDLEHWPAFADSYQRLADLLKEQTAESGVPPVVLSGDVHFAYVSEYETSQGSKILQLVSSPLRQGDRTHEQTARAAALTGWFTSIMGVLARRSNSGLPTLSSQLLTEVWTANNIATLRYGDDGSTLAISLDRSYLADGELGLDSLASLRYPPARHR